MADTDAKPNDTTDFDHAVAMTDETTKVQEEDLATGSPDFDHAVAMTDDTAKVQEEDLGTGSPTTGKAAEATQAIRDQAGKIGQQAADKARLFAEDGKAKASGALDQLSQMLADAAGQVDDKLGAQYGQYARTAATTVQGFSEQVRNKDIDALIDDARGFVKSSPAVAIGAAAAVGFVVARLIQSGLDDQKA